MPRFVAVTAKGLESELQAELAAMGVRPDKAQPAGVAFESNWAGAYRVNLRSRLATRVLLTVLDFPAYKPEDLYSNIRKHDFTKYIDATQTLSVEASTRDSVLNDSRFVALKVKDALVDQFRDKFGSRPDVDKEDSDLKIYVKSYKNNFSVSVDTSGLSLHRRGYRDRAGEAPLRENLAAGLLQISQWNAGIPLVDPFCGSGTILIEAALKAANIAPGTLRSEFGFQRHKTYQPEIFESELEACLGEEIEPELKLFGYDVDSKVLQIAQRNAKLAGVDHLITFDRQNVQTLQNPVAEEGKVGFVLTNPPYGARLGEAELLKDVYKDFAFTLRSQFRNWTAWVLSGNAELTQALRMKAERKYPLWNGPLECRLLRYRVFPA